MVKLPVFGAVSQSALLTGGAMVAIALYMYSRRDTNGDGKPDSFGYNIGRDAVGVVGDAIGGVIDGTISAGDSVLDKIADPVGASSSDCELYKKDNNQLGIIWACWPSDWFKQ